MHTRTKELAGTKSNGAFEKLDIALVWYFLRKMWNQISMRKLKLLVFSIFLVTAIVGCREGYVIKPATLNVVGLNDESKIQLLDFISSTLKKEGFEDLGKNNEMISHIQNGNLREDTKAEQIARLNRERHFLNREKRLRVVCVDYMSSEPPMGYVAYTPPAKHFIEINIYDEQSDGFSSNGRDFFSRFVSSLKERFGNSIVVIKEPA